MKRFCLALISILVFGAGLIFAACGERKVELTLSASDVEICINEGQTIDEPVINAQVSGVDSGRVSAKSSNEHVVVATATYNQDTKQNQISLTIPKDKDGKVIGIEGQAQVEVKCLDDTSVFKTIAVTVYSDIMGMTEKTDGFQTGKNPKFAIKGGTVTLNPDKLLVLSKDTRTGARKDIRWEVEDAGASIDGNILTVSQSFAGDELTVYAVPVYNESARTAVHLHVLPKLDESIKIEHTNQISSGYTSIEENSTLRIWTNDDEEQANSQRNGYVRVSFAGSDELQINALITGKTIQDVNGNVYQIIRADKVGDPVEEDGMMVYTFKVSAINQIAGKDGPYDPSINGDSQLKFEIKDAVYDYPILSQTLDVASYEKVNEIRLTDDSPIPNDVTAPEYQNNIYTRYYQVNQGYGKLYNVEVLPTTAYNKTGKFYITVDFEGIDMGGNNLDNNPVEISYNLGKFAFINLTKQGSYQYVSDTFPEGVKQIYIRGGSGIVTQVKDVEITFISVDDPSVKASFKANFYKSSDSDGTLKFDESDIGFVESTNFEETKEVPLTLTLRGQTSTVGLSVDYSQNSSFTVTGFYNATTGEDRNSVKFDIRLRITEPGVTLDDGWFQINHENGLKSERFPISLFLPLSDVTITHSLSSNNEKVNSMKTSNNSWTFDGDQFTKQERGLSIQSMLISSPATVPVDISTNTKNGYYSQLTQMPQYLYLDRTDSNSNLFDLELDNLTEQNILQIYQAGSGVSSNIVLNGTDLSTKSAEGMTYLLAIFTGIDENAQPITIARLMRFELHVAVGSMKANEPTIRKYTISSVNDRSLAQEHIVITLGDNLTTPVKYCDLDNFTFISNQLGEGQRNDNIVSWPQRNYIIEHLTCDGFTLEFDFTANSTSGNTLFSDSLTIAYSFANIDSSVLLQIHLTNADRVEEVVWHNASEEGLYFELYGENDEQVISTSVLPDNAMNKTLSYISFKFTQNGKLSRDDSFVSVSPVDYNGFVNIGTAHSAGRGYIFVLPQDSYQGNNLTYFYGSAKTEKTITLDQLGDDKVFEELMSDDAYFISNSNQKVLFKNIIKKVPVTVADGKSFDTAYRLYDSLDFWQLDSNGYYIVMNNVVLENWGTAEKYYWTEENLYGGIRGYREGITITLTDNSKSFVNTLGSDSKKDSEISNLTFAGSASGAGFVANKNYGVIKNVTVDIYATDTIQSSTLTSTDTYTGGAVGENYGTIDNVAVLGLTISNTNAKTAYVGGIAGLNNGTIKNARFEIYTFEVSKDEGKRTELQPNSISVTGTDSFVGGFVGQMTGGSIVDTFAYDYTLANSTESVSANIKGGKQGAFVGEYSAGSLSSVFAVLNVTNITGGVSEQSSIAPSDYYIGNYSIVDGKLTYTITPAKDQIQNETGYNAANWVQPNAQGWHSYVNGDENPHLKNIFQSQPLSAGEIQAIGLSQTVKKSTYYQAINGSNDKVLMFYYQVAGFSELGSRESSDLQSYNTILISDLLTSDTSFDGRLAITSSNTNVVAVSGDTLVVKGTGDAALTISSKQNFSTAASKQIQVSVIYPLSDIKAYWTTPNAQGYIEARQNSQVSLQRESSAYVTYIMEHQTVVLGNTQNSTFDLLQNAGLKYMSTLNDESQNIEGNTLTFTSDLKSKETNVISTNATLGLNINNEKNGWIEKTVRDTFAHSFTINLVNGAISLSLTGNSVSITPSLQGQLDADLVTNNEDDDITIYVWLVEEDDLLNELTCTQPKDEKGNTIKGVYEYRYQNESTPRLRVEVSERLEPERDEVEGGASRWTRHYTISVTVADGYKSRVSEPEKYRITAASASNVKSASVDVNVTRQEITHLDINAYSTSSQFNSSVSPSRLYYPLNSNSRISVMRPGDNALVVVNVNPDYAAYDYIRLTTEDTPNVESVKLYYMERINAGNQDYFVDGAFSTDDRGIRVSSRPADSDRIVFRVWVNDAVAQDSLLKLRIAFYRYTKDGGEEEVEHAYHYISISYLAAPVVTVGGRSEEALLARGSSIEARVELNYDQSVDMSISGLTNVKSNIYRTAWEEVDDGTQTGRRVFKCTISAGLDAQLFDDAKEMYLHVVIERTLNGLPDTKTVDFPIRLVNFVLDVDRDSNGMELETNKMSLEGGLDRAESSSTGDDAYIAYVGVERSLNFKYSLLPERYNDVSNNASESQALGKIMTARQDFESDGFYKPNPEDTGEYEYYAINYNYDSAGNLVQIPVENRLEYQTSSGEWAGIYNNNGFVDIGGALTFRKTSSGGLTITGKNQTQANTPIRFRLTTYVKDGEKNTDITKYRYYFSITIAVYSSYDLPKPINSLTEFNNALSGEPGDYILMTDLTLESWTPVSTSSLRSLDGNGHMIYIKSFNTRPDGDELKLALFDEVSDTTLLKNLKVNIYGAGQIYADISQYTSVQIAGFAITNAGIITNCEVVTFMPSASGYSRDALTQGVQGLNIIYTNGRGTDREEIMTDTTWSSQVAGFVIENQGNITNSRVGGDDIDVLQGYKPDQKDTMTASTVALDIFNINAQGDMAGFVLENTSGTISSSYAKRIAMNNKSEDINRYLAGFVGTNSGRINSSYVEGDGSSESDKMCKVNTSLASNLTVIAGFIYENRDGGYIKDCYSNILISNDVNETEETQHVYLASGFVYRNLENATIENAYSASQVKASRFSQMNFTGTTLNGNVNNSGTYINCYYYASRFYTADQDVPEQYLAKGATKLSAGDNQNNFYGFAFATNQYSNDGVWFMHPTEGVKLVEANMIAMSHRYYNELETPDAQGNAYQLPYANIDITGNSGPITLKYGSSYNPIIIRTAREFDDVMGASQANDVKSNFTDDTINGHYRLVNDIDLSEISTSGSEENFILSSSTRAFTGSLYGNGFTISNLSISSSGINATALSFGMFASIESATLINFNLTVANVSNTQASIVGALSGLVISSKIVNIEITGLEGSSIDGGNFVGGLAGMVLGESSIRNITITNPDVTTKRFDTNADENKSVFTLAAANSWRDRVRNAVLNTVTTKLPEAQITDLMSVLDNNCYSYAGGLIGYVDIYDTTSSSTAYVHNMDSSRELKDYSLATLRVNNAKVKAQVVGGVIGFQGISSYIMDAGLTIDGTGAENENTHIVSTKFYAGGVIGQAMSGLSQIFAVHEIDEQNAIEDNINKYYSSNLNVERGALDIFDTGIENEKYPGIKAVGGLIGLANSGEIEISYSKLNVISMNAEYAGGVIGKVDVSAYGSTYQFSSGPVLIDTKYLLHEVYATGDVRAKGTEVNGTKFGAGGIIGSIKTVENETESVSLWAVNAFNMFSYTDYENAESTETPNITKLDSLGVYTILGDSNHDALNFVQVQRTTDAEATAAAQDSVGVITRYAGTTINAGGFVAAWPYANFDTNAQDNYWNSEAKLKGVFGIQNYYEIQSRDGGQSIVHGYFFTNSGTWDALNWIHDNLYPTIRYTASQVSVIWLDAYSDSIAAALRQMNTAGRNSNIEVRVRGFKEGTTEVGDIDFRAFAYEQENKLDNPVDYKGKTFVSNPFGGKLVYSPEWTGNSITVPRILLDRPLFSSLAEGYAIDSVTFALGNVENSGLTVEQLGGFTDEEGTSYTGAIVNSSATKGIITNVKIEVHSNVYLVANQTSNIGLFASDINNSNINSMEISIKNMSGSALTVLSKDGDTLTAGLIAGKYEMNDVNVGYSITEPKINVEPTIPAITITDAKDSNTTPSLSVGGFFGQVNATGGDQNQRLTKLDLGSLASPNLSAGQQNPLKISIKKNFGDLNLGGSFGAVTGRIPATLSEVGSSDKAFQVEFDIAGNSTDGSGDNVGLVIGKLESENEMTTIGGTSRSNIQGTITADGTLKSANIGGVVGYSASGLTLQDIQMSISTSGAQRLEKLDEQVEVNLDARAEDGLAVSQIKVSGDSNIGSYAGRVGGQLVIIGNSMSNETNIARKGFGIAAEGSNTNINLGGLVGQATTGATITGYMSIQPVYYLAGDLGTVNYGGLIGELTLSGESKIVQDDTPGDAGVIITKLVKTDLIVDGQNAGVVSGGMIGKLVTTTPTDDKKPSITIAQTAFGGTLRTVKAGNVTMGGTIGSVNPATPLTDKTKPTIKLENNLNYGDMFNIKASLSYYYFAGLIGHTAEAIDTVQAQNNYSLMTNHNARDIVGSGTNFGTVRALFGANIQGGDLTKNYYNHALSMATDEQGTDVGYQTAYGAASSYKGYGKSKSSTGILTSLHVGEKPVLDTSKIHTLDQDCNTEGTKFKPYTLSNATKIEHDKSSTENNNTTYYSTNAIQYYAVKGNITLGGDNAGTLFDSNSAQEITNQNNIKAMTLDNVAIIGDSNMISYIREIAHNESGDSYPGLQPLFQQMQGYSFVSGLLINAKIQSETAESAVKANDRTVGGLVNIMTGNSKVYSVGVTGSIDIGGTETSMTIGGIAGKMDGGCIDESNSSLDITYRGKSGAGKLSGITSSASSAWIVNSYSAGSIYTYTPASVYAFANGSDSTVENCYTITRTTVTDVTSTKSLADASVISGVATVNFVANQAATEIANGGTSTGTGEDTLSQKYLKALGWIEGLTVTNWSTEAGYNFAYPIHKNFYTNQTSYFKREIVETKQIKEGQDVQVGGIESNVSAIDQLKNTYADIVMAAINRYVYSRVLPANLSTPDDTYYYGIPTAERLAEINSISSSNNFVMLYDINMTKAYGDAGNASIELLGTDESGSGIANVQLDFNGKAIYNLRNSLFKEISAGGKLENLRIVDAVLTDQASLANTVSSSIHINNVSAQGDIALGTTVDNNLTPASVVVGGVVSTATGTTFSNISSMMIINGSTTQDVGGIVGTLSGGNILFSSNNATLIIRHKGSDSRSYGGLVGYAPNGANIAYSYNAAGIAVDYASVGEGPAHIGGLVGHIEAGGTIDNCYNTGTVRAGTKQSEKQLDVGGIAGINQGTITNCHNEASIEGRSKSSWGFQDTGRYVFMKQGTQYLNVYGIAYCDDGSVSGCSVSSDAQIVRNGNALSDGTVIYKWDKIATKDSGNNSDGYGMGFYQCIDANYHAFAVTKNVGQDDRSFLQRTVVGDMRMPIVSSNSQNMIVEGRSYDLPELQGQPIPGCFLAKNNEQAHFRIGDFKKDIQDKIWYNVYNTGEQSTNGGNYTTCQTVTDVEKGGSIYIEDGREQIARNIAYQSYDDYGFPKGISFEYGIYQHLYNNTRWVYFLSGSYSRHDRSNTIVTSRTTAYYNWNANRDNGWLTAGEMIDKINYVSNNIATDTETQELSNLQAVIASSRNTTSDRTELIWITGEKYCLTYGDQESIRQAVEKGMYKYKAEITISETDLPYFEAHKDRYYASAIENGEVRKDLTITISTDDITKVGTDVSFILTISSSNEMREEDWQNISFKISCSKEDNANVDFSNANYIYTIGDADNKVVTIVLEQDEDLEDDVDNSQNGVINSKLAQDEENLSFFIPTGDAEEPYTQGSGKVFKARKKGTEEDIYLVYDSSNGTIKYYQNIKIGSESSASQNIDDLSPTYFIAGEFEYEITKTVTATGTVDEIGGIVEDGNKLSNTNISGEKSASAPADSTESVSANSDITLGSKGSVGTVNDPTKVEIEKYKDILATLGFEIDINEVADEGKADPSDGTLKYYYLGDKSDPIAKITVKTTTETEGSSTRQITAIELLKEKFEIISGDNTFGVTASMDSDSNNLKFAITEPEGFGVSDDNDAVLNGLLEKISITKGIKLTEESAITFSNEIDHYENISFEIDLPSGDMTKAAIAKDKQLLAKYQSGAWSLGANIQESKVNIGGTTFNISISEGKLILTLENASTLAEITAAKTAIEGLDVYKQTRELTDTWTEEGDARQTSQKKTGSAEHYLDYNYDEKYSYAIGNTNFEGEGYTASASLNGDNRIEIKFSEKAVDGMFDDEDFYILTGIKFAETITVTKSTTLSNLSVTFKNDTQSDVWIEAEMTADGAAFGAEDKEFTKGSNGTSHTRSADFNNFTINYTILTKYIDVSVKADTTKDGVSHSYDYDLNFNNNHLKFSLTSSPQQSYTGDGFTATVDENGNIAWVDDSGDIFMRKVDGQYYRAYDYQNIEDMEVDGKNVANLKDFLGDIYNKLDKKLELTGITKGMVGVGENYYFFNESTGNIEPVNSSNIDMIAGDAKMSQNITIRSPISFNWFIDDELDSTISYQMNITSGTIVLNSYFPTTDKLFEEPGDGPGLWYGDRASDAPFLLQIDVSNENVRKEVLVNGEPIDTDEFEFPLIQFGYILNDYNLSSSDSLSEEAMFTPKTGDNVYKRDGSWLKYSDLSKVEGFAYKTSKTSQGNNRFYINNTSIVSGECAIDDIQKSWASKLNKNEDELLRMPSAKTPEVSGDFLQGSTVYASEINIGNVKSEDWYIVNGNKITFNYAIVSLGDSPALMGNRGNVKIKIIFSRSALKEINDALEKESDADPYAGIILTKDLDVGVVGELQYIAQMTTNLIGNHHFIKFEQIMAQTGAEEAVQAFIGTLASGQHMKDLMVVGQQSAVGNGGYAILMQNNTGTIANVKVYGSIYNLSTDQNASATPFIYMNGETGTILNVDSNVSIYGLNATTSGGNVSSNIYGFVSGSLIDTEGSSNIKQSGILIAGDGRSGEDGSFGKDSYRKRHYVPRGNTWYSFEPAGNSSRAGSSGGTGGSISLSLPSSAFAGLLRAGNGGNAGAGGTGGKGMDLVSVSYFLDEDSSYENISTVGGKGSIAGERGEAGKIVDNNNQDVGSTFITATSGSNALSGNDGEEGLGGVYFSDETTYKPWAYVVQRGKYNAVKYINFNTRYKAKENNQIYFTGGEFWEDDRDDAFNSRTKEADQYNFWRDVYGGNWQRRYVHGDTGMPSYYDLKYYCDDDKDFQWDYEVEDLIWVKHGEMNPWRSGGGNTVINWFHWDESSQKSSDSQA